MADEKQMQDVKQAFGVGNHASDFHNAVAGVPNGYNPTHHLNHKPENYRAVMGMDSTEGEFGTEIWIRITAR